jgi:TatD DNase family protein
MIELVDTHCHIQSIGQARGERITREIWAKHPELTIDKVLDNASVAGVNHLICVGCDLSDSQLVVDFVQQHDTCWASIGIHPHEAKQQSGESLAALAALATQPKVVAIGECGLDFYYKHSPKADQIKVLEFQLELAQTAGLPLIFHVREAFDDFWPVLDNFKDLRGVLHSYTDTKANLDKAVDRGFYIGVNGIATFAKDAKLIEVYKSVPLDHLLLETDAPFLTPAPHRGSINEPQHIAATAAFLAELRGEKLEELAAATTHNARQLFGL